MTVRYQVSLTDKQCEVVTDILIWWVTAEDYEEATKDVEQDPGHDEPEDMLQAVDGMHSIFNTVQSAINELNRARGLNGRTPS